MLNTLWQNIKAALCCHSRVTQLETALTELAIARLYNALRAIDNDSQGDNPPDYSVAIWEGAIDSTRWIIEDAGLDYVEMKDIAYELMGWYKCDRCDAWVSDCEHGNLL